MACTTFLPAQPWLQHSLLAPSLLQIARIAAILAPAGLEQHLSAVLNHLNTAPR